MTTPDVGWPAAARLSRRYILSPARLHRAGADLPILLSMRAFALHAPLWWLVAGVVVAFLGGVADLSAAVWPWLMAIAGGTGVFRTARMRTRAQHAHRMPDLADDERAVFFHGYGLSQVPVALGFVGTVLTGEITLYPMGVVLAILVLLPVVPTDAYIRARDARHRMTGSSLSVERALLLPGRMLPGAE